MRVARVYEQDKAGLERQDAHERVTRGHASSSSAGNSGYDEQEEKKEERVRERVSEIRQQLRTLTQPQIDAARRKVRETVAALEAARDLSRVWLHVDMDMFYGTPLTHSLTHSLARSLAHSLALSLTRDLVRGAAACEIKANEQLRDKPFAVGGLGMISTASYHARKFGVRSAMPVRPRALSMRRIPRSLRAPD